MQKFSLSVIMAAALLASTSTAYAARVENCDKVAHEVTVVNGGETKKVTLEPGRHYDAIGPMVSFQVKGQEPIEPRWFDDWCIWSGKLKIQRRHRYNGNGRF